MDHRIDAFSRDARAGREEEGDDWEGDADEDASLHFTAPFPTLFRSSSTASRIGPSAGSRASARLSLSIALSSCPNR